MLVLSVRAMPMPLSEKLPAAYRPQEPYSSCVSPKPYQASASFDNLLTALRNPPKSFFKQILIKPERKPVASV